MADFQRVLRHLIVGRTVLKEKMQGDKNSVPGSQPPEKIGAAKLREPDRVAAGMIFIFKQRNYGPPWPIASFSLPALPPMQESPSS